MDIAWSLCSPQTDVSIPVVYCGWAGAHQPLPDVRGRGLGGPAPLAVSERQVGAVWKGGGQHARYAPCFEGVGTVSPRLGAPWWIQSKPPCPCTGHLGFKSPSHSTTSYPTSAPPISRFHSICHLFSALLWPVFCSVFCPHLPLPCLVRWFPCVLFDIPFRTGKRGPHHCGYGPGVACQTG